MPQQTNPKRRRVDVVTIQGRSSRHASLAKNNADTDSTTDTDDIVLFRNTAHVFRYIHIINYTALMYLQHQ